MTFPEPDDDPQVLNHRLWQQQRNAELAARDSWLGLIGLYWLEPGLNNVGSSEDAIVKLPDEQPHRGDLCWENGRVFWQLDGAPIVELQTDIAGNPTTVDLGNLSFFIVDRDGHLAARLRDRNWAAGKPFAGLDYFDFDPAWQIEAEWQSLSPPLRMEVHNVSGELKTVDVAHQAVFQAAGQTVTLLPMSVSDKEVFFVFRDRTSGKETYGAGRFLKVPARGAPGRRQNKPRFQPRLQSALRLHPLRHLSAAATGKLVAVCRAGGGKEVGESGVSEGRILSGRRIRSDKGLIESAARLISIVLRAVSSRRP